MLKAIIGEVMNNFTNATFIYDKENFVGYEKIEIHLRTLFDPNFNIEQEPLRHNDDFFYLFTAFGDEFRFEVNLSKKPDFDCLNGKPTWSVLIDEDVFDYSNYGIKNRVVTLKLLQEIFTFSKPEFGFAVHGINLENINTKNQTTSEDLKRTLFGINYLHTDLVKQIGKEKFDNLPFVKIKETEVGIILGVNEYEYFGFNLDTFPNEIDFAKCNSNEIKQIADYLGMTWFGDL